MIFIIYQKLIENYSDCGNLDGSSQYFDYMSIADLLNSSRVLLESFHDKWSFTNVCLPDAIGANSLGFNADAINPETRENISIFIKITISYRDDYEVPRKVQSISAAGISPKILQEEIIEYGSPDKVVSITLSERVIPYITFYNMFRTIDIMKQSIVTFVDNVFKLHKINIIHNDLKYENIGFLPDGTLRLFDYDNSFDVTKYTCPISRCSSICIPPLLLRKQYIKQGLGNRCVDLFPLVACSLGDFIHIKSWQFGHEEAQEKLEAIQQFNKVTIYQLIHRNLEHIIPDYNYDEKNQDPFWFTFINLVQLIIQEVEWRNKKSFLKRANVLISRLKSQL